MIQEFISALYGYTGDIFIEDKNGNIKIIDGISFIAPTEQSLMNEVCILGTFYRKINKFIIKFSSPLINRETSGLVKVSLSSAIIESLENYKCDLIFIEKEMLKDEFLSISFIKSYLNQYFIFFPILWNILNEIIDLNLRGCQILDIIYKNIPSGSEKMRIILNKILKKCNNVFYNQLSAWLLRGALFDPYKEFFIESISINIEKSEINTLNERILIDNMTKSQLNDIFSDCISRNKTFKINIKNIPCFVPISLANKILFIGESVHLFDRNTQGMINTNYWNEASFEENKLKNELSLKYSDNLKKLRNSDEYNLLRVQELVENVESYVRKRMWALLIKENNFLETIFVDIKDFFLLGRGELLMEFISSMERTLIGCDYNSTTESSINSEFLKASHTVLLDKDDIIKMFRFIVGKKNEGEPLRWEDIHLTYNVTWPFHIIFTADILASYNDIFRFLILLKRTQMRLYQGFDRRKFKNMLHDKQWLIRNQMNFLFNNLQYYLQVDVIESQTLIFQKEVLANEDIEVLKDLHDKLINSLKDKAFLFNRTINNGFINLSETCIEYCNFIQIDSEFNKNPNSIRKLEQLREKLHSTSSLLYNILSNVEDHLTSNPHLRQLLLRLDFNNFFSKIGIEIGSLKKESHKIIKTFNV